MGEYEARVAEERRQYAENEEIHALPGICFYWLTKYILPQLASFGYAGADEFFLLNLERAYDGAAVGGCGRVRRFVSLGAGNCDLEVRLAEGLRASGRTEFVFDCLDLNAAMIARGAAAASEKGLAGVIQPLVADFNAWGDRSVRMTQWWRIRPCTMWWNWRDCWTGFAAR